MKKLIFLDTETTGFEPGQIAQLTYIIEHEDILTPKNFFFNVDEMSEGAAKVHGFTKERLVELSKGQVFKDIHEQVLKDFEDSILICHNVNFDYNFLKAEFKRLEIELKLPKFCTMLHFTNICKILNQYDKYKWPKLSELINFYNIPENDVITRSKELFISDDVTFHDARFDTVGLYMAFKTALEKNDITKETFLKSLS